jgi:hypothetical protein
MAPRKRAPKSPFDDIINPYSGDKGRVPFKGIESDPNVVTGSGNKKWLVNPATGKRTMSGAEFSRYTAASNQRVNMLIGPTFGEVTRQNNRTRTAGSRMVSTGGLTYNLGLKNVKGGKRSSGK